MNTKLLKQIATLIQRKPETFDMAHYACGTTSCVAGTAIAMTDKKVFQHCSIMNSGPVWFHAGAKALDLTEAEANRLFFRSYWPKAFWNESMLLTPTSLAYAHVAARRIQHFIKTEGRE